MKFHDVSARWVTPMLGIALAFLLPLVSGLPAAPSEPPPSSAQQPERMKERDRLEKEFQKLRGQGKRAQAIGVGEKILALERELFGNSHEEVIGTLEQLAGLLDEQGDAAAALKARREVLAVRTQLHGDKHWRTISARAWLDHSGFLAELTTDQRQRLGESEQLIRRSNQLYRDGQATQALPLANQALQIRKEIQGETGLGYASALNMAAIARQALGDYPGAEALFGQALEITKQVLGMTHPIYATALNNLAAILLIKADYPRAELLYQRALEIRKQAYGAGDYWVAASLNDLALLYKFQGDYLRAEPLYRQALEIYQNVSGDVQREYAISLDNLAVLYMQVGEYARAEPLLHRALELRRKTVGEKNPEYATSLHNLAGLYEAKKDYIRAERLCQEVVELDRKILGEKHHYYATALSQLGMLYLRMGDLSRAEPLLRQVLELRKQIGWETHPAVAASLYNLALVCWFQGDAVQAARFLTKCLDVAAGNLELAANAQSERQQLALAQELRSYLDLWISLAPQAQAGRQEVYQRVVRWKGIVFARQQRLLQEMHRPELAPLYADWQTVCRRLATLALTTPAPEAQQRWSQQLAELTDRKEQLESQLARNSAPFRAQQGTSQRTAALVRATLPEGTALVDFLDYGRFAQPNKDDPQPGRVRHLAAFIVRADRPIEQLDLGPTQAIEEAIDAWRTAVKEPAQGKDLTRAADRLRHLLWQPLEEYLSGARTVLVSPDGALARLPLGALPGKKPNSYLLEEVALAVLPVPQLLPELLAVRSDPIGTGPPRSPESLLLVGDIDYGAAESKAILASASRSAPRSSRGSNSLSYQPLPATRDELLALRGSFERRFPQGRVRMLTQLQATEDALRSEAPRHRWLHLATHGFFAPPELVSALGPRTPAPGAALVGVSDLFSRQGISGFHPGLLSGLVLSGANRPPEPDADDGIWTALEVAELDLGQVELAVLSACETGLGRVAGGEGLLGLQRAFQVAGAHSVLASLWNVDDHATAVLMIEFYRNLWEKGLSRLEALRQAQLALLHNYDPKGRRLRGPGTVTPAKDPEASSRAQAELRKQANLLPPRYWAGFVLSGDWR